MGCQKVTETLEQVRQELERTEQLKQDAQKDLKKVRWTIVLGGFGIGVLVIFALGISWQLLNNKAKLASTVLSIKFTSNQQLETVPSSGTIYFWDWQWTKKQMIASLNHNSIDSIDEDS